MPHPPPSVVHAVAPSARPAFHSHRCSGHLYFATRSHPALHVGTQCLRTGLKHTGINMKKTRYFMSVTLQNPQLHFMRTGWKGTKKVDDGIIGEFLVTIQVRFVSSFESPYHGLCPQDVGWGFFRLGTLNSVVDSLLKITNFGSLGVSCCSPAVATTKNGWLSHPTCRLLSASAQTTSWHHGRLLLAACLLENCITQRIFPIRRLSERPKSKTSCITSGFLGDLSFVLPEKDVPLENCQGGQDPAVSYNRIAESS